MNGYLTQNLQDQCNVQNWARPNMLISLHKVRQIVVILTVIREVTSMIIEVIALAETHQSILLRIKAIDGTRVNINNLHW